MSFLKSVFLGLRRKIGEPIMILLTVAIAVTTFVSALTLRTSVERTATESYRSLSGGAELEATLSDDLSVYYLTGDSVDYRALEEESSKYGDLYAGYLFYASVGKEEGRFATLYASDLDALSRYNPVAYLSGENKALRTGIVLGESFAHKIGAETGDSLVVTRYGSAQKLTLTVTGVAAEKGVFATADALVSEEAVSRLLSLGDDVRVYDRFYIDLSEEKLAALGVTIEQAAKAIEEKATSFTLSSPVKDKDVRITLAYQSTLLFVIAFIVAALGAVLIYTAVSLLLKNRLSVAAIFKSVGASAGSLSLYLFLEILLYGVLGSLLGLVGSLGANLIFGALTGSAVGFSLDILSALIGVLFGVVLSLLSAAIPVCKLATSPLSEMLRADSPLLHAKPLPAAVAGGAFAGLFLWTAFAKPSVALLSGVFSGLALPAFLFALMPFVVKGVSCLLCRATRDDPRFGKIYLASSGARANRHAQSGARLLAIAVTAVVAVAVLLGEANAQLRSFDAVFRSDIMISASSESLPDIVKETREEEGVTGSYLAYVETHCAIEGEEENTVTLLAARGQEYEAVFRAAEFGVDVPAIVGVRRAAMGGGLALKLGLSVGEEFALVVNGERTVFTLATLIDTPLTVVFTDLSGLGVDPNLCLVNGTEEVFNRLSEKYALEGAVYRASDAFAYVTRLAVDYIKVFSLFEALVFLFAAVGYLISALSSFRDRKREYELLVAVGASRGDVKRLVFAENAIVVFVSLFIGALFSVALLFIVQNMLKSLGLYFTLLG